MPRDGILVWWRLLPNAEQFGSSVEVKHDVPVTIESGHLGAVRPKSAAQNASEYAGVRRMFSSPAVR
jgi:hypothetical protein